MKFFRYAGLALAVAATVPACSSDDDSSGPTPVTCGHVCQRYADCYNGNYDVGGCTTRCTNDATASQEKDDKLKTCNDCIGDKSCTSATFNCATECGSFVP